MANAVGGNGIARWAGAIGGAVAAHGALLLCAIALPGTVPAAAERVDPLVWLEAPPPAQGEHESAATDPTSAAPAEPPPRPVHARRARNLRRGPASKAANEVARPIAAPSAATPDELSPASGAPEANAQPPAELVAAVGTGDSNAPSSTGAPRAGLAAGGSGRGTTASGTPAFPPGLIAFGDPCRGFYPASANADHGEVRVMVRVGPDGRTHDSRVVAEMPARQGFGSAARACVTQLKFRPARDRAGSAMPGQALLALRFDRS